MENLKAEISRKLQVEAIQIEIRIKTHAKNGSWPMSENNERPNIFLLYKGPSKVL